MNSELQTVIERLELVERQSRSWKLTAMLALVAAVAALVLPLAQRGATAPDRARFSVVEANRFLLRDLNGTVAGGFESNTDGTLRMVLGSRTTASAHLVIARDGSATLTLRSPDGQVRAGLGGAHPSVWVSPAGGAPVAALRTRDDGGGELVVRDADGRARFRAP